MSWWRRQRVPLIALLVTMVAAVGVHVWFDVLPTSEAKASTVVEVEHSGEISGQKIAISTVRVNEFDAPAGSHTISVLLDASGGPDATSCGDLTLSEVNGTRIWLDARSDIAVPYDAGERSCREESLSYDIFVVFLVPDDAVGPFHLDVAGGVGDDRTLRFSVDP